MAKIIIFGTGKGAIIATKYFNHDTDHEIVAYTTHKAFMSVDNFNGRPVIAFDDIEQTHSPADHLLFAPLGYDEMNKFRERIFNEGKQKGYTFATYVHSSVKTIEPISIGENCFILENQSINLDVKIGNNVTMWSANQIGDRTIIEDHVWISSHVCISGDVHIKSNCVLAVNSTVANQVIMEVENFIGANALISKNTLPKEVYIVSPTAKAPLASDRFIKMIKRV